MAPGYINPELQSLLKAGNQKQGGHPAVTAIVNWFIEQCGIHGPGSMVPEDLQCCLLPAFFSTNTIQAIQACSIKSACTLVAHTEPLMIITPWYFLRSLQPLNSPSQSRLPRDGLRTSHITD
jgi:hypothetical protein